MIKSIFVRNFVLIDSLTLDFTKAYSCFTGETGAGKSLLIDAIGILCGDRVNTSYIKKGAEKAFIEAVIEIEESHPSYQLLIDNDYVLEDGCFVVSREITQAGKSTVKINQRTTTLSFSKEVLSSIIDIHSQHDNQYLLNTKYHLTLLDAFSNHTGLQQEVQALYKQYTNSKATLENFLQEEANPDDLAYYQFQLDEMQALNIQENELESLEERQKELASFDKVSSQLVNAIQALEKSQYEMVYEASKHLNELPSETIQTAREELLSAYYAIDEQITNIKDYRDQLSFDEQEYNALQERIFTIHNVFRKHGNSYSSFMQKYEEYEQKIAAIENRETRVVVLQKEVETALANFLEKAKVLSTQRKEQALLLQQRIQNELLDLHLENAKCEIAFEEQINAYGIDKVEFLISMNKGVSLQPLAKVASGGELSRLMLGLKNIFNALQGIQTVIFDEIDNGVSGQVAYSIGKKMHLLGSFAQVFSVTHLAPVAAWASAHYLVSKSQSEDTTSTSVILLNEEQTIHELANIAHGSTSESSLTAAKELYDSCRM